jgi:restriction endonuclease S subunit/tRNA1(Val) A37 N6-methylase TrmN6
MADFTKYSFNDLVKYCKENDIAYMGKNKKPYKDKTIIRNIMKKLSEKTIIVNEVIEEKVDEEVKLLNEVVWTLEKTQDTNKEYKEIKDNLCKIVKKCHDLLYSSHAVVGIKAQNDIMKLLTLLILQPQFANNDSELMIKCKKLLENKEISKENYDKYIGYCLDLNKLADADNILSNWEFFIRRFLSKILPIIYTDEDVKFNNNDEIVVAKIIKIVKEININSNFIDAFSTSYGDIHEAFRVYSGGKGAKELGQFFTPRNLIHALFHGSGLNEIIKSYDNPTIYDCCMGTGGLLTRAYSNGNILPNNIYGCEMEKDTIKFGECSLLLTTKVFNSNIIKCDSLCNNPYIFNIKYDIIFTNPPFGTKMNYEDLQKKFNNYKDLNYPDNIINFKDVYPIKSNNGACLFIQHCMYMLKEKGTCSIVLPDGELFYGKTYLKLRKFICENVNIIKIINVEGGAFEHTSIKTSIIIFQKNGSTKNIEFMEINKECNEVKSCSIVNINNIVNKNYIFNYNNYIKKESKINKKIEIKKLGDICEIQNGKRIVKDKVETGEYPVLGGGGFTSFYTNEYTREGKTCKISREGMSLNNCVMLLNEKYYLNSQAFTIISNNIEYLNNEYLWYYLNNIKDVIFGCGRGTAQLAIDIEKFKNIEIPIPSLEVQETIIKKIDKITKSIETIKLRISQLKDEEELFMEIYIENTDIEIKKLGDICEINQGDSLTKKEFVEGLYDVIGGGKIIGKHNINNRDGNEIVLTRVGDIHINYIEKAYYLTDNAFSLKSLDKNYNIKYIYYILLYNIDKYLKDLYIGTAQKVISKTSLNELEIHLPSLEIQEKIVKQLDIIYKKIDDDYEYIKSLEDLSKIIISTTSVKSP